MQNPTTGDLALPAAEHPHCGVCGLLHPLVNICPYIAEQEIREEYAQDRGRRRLVARVTRTRYYRRPEIAAASVASLDDEAPADGAPATP